MNGPVQLVTPDRLRIQEGGGCLSVFGLPFFGAGVLLFLILLRIVPVNNADQMPAFMCASACATEPDNVHGCGASCRRAE